MKILVTTDYSSFSDNALAYAINLGKELKGEICLVHVFQIPPPVSEVPLLIVSAEEMMDEHSKRLQKLIQLHTGDDSFDITYKVLTGNIVNEVTQFVHQNSYDLIVSGIENTGLIEEFFIGTTSMGFIRNSKVPVLIIPSECTFHKGPLVFAYDGNEKGNTYPVNFLKNLSHGLDVELHIVSVLDEGSEDDDTEEQEIYTKLNIYFKEISYESHIVYHNDVDAGLTKTASEMNASFLALISHKHGLLNRIFNETHTKRIAYRSKVPVLAIPEVDRNNLSILLS